MMRTRIKICGITDSETANAAIQAGASALGFIFFKKSPRYIEPEKARKIINSLPPFVDAVGVFVDEKIDLVKEIIQFCGLTVAQLHGSESPEYCSEISIRVLKAIRVHDETDHSSMTPYQGVINGFLLDTWQPAQPGGTGKIFNWKIIEKLKGVAPLVIAGGLGPENVSELIQQIHPYAIDVNSGVETEPGKKSIKKINQLMVEISRVESEHCSG
jgi:phosphoribosylanthranilate isomerase